MSINGLICAFVLSSRKFRIFPFRVHHPYVRVRDHHLTTTWLVMSSILIEQIIPAVSHILQIFPDGVPEMGRAEYRGRKMEQWSLAMNVPLEVHHSGIRDYFMQQIGMDEFVRRILTFWAAHTAPCNRTIEHLRAALDSTVSMTSNESCKCLIPK